MPFLDTPRFPDEISAWAVGGRGFNTTVVQTYGGDDFRNQNWTMALGQWEIPSVERITNPVLPYSWKLLRNFFMVLRGGFNTFRFKDGTDYTDEAGGVFIAIDATHFQMYKNYTVGALTYQQIINKPVFATVVVTGGVAPVVDYSTGIVAVSSGTPTSWTGQFDIPVRFVDDFPRNGLDSSGALYSWQSMKLVEVRNP